MKGLDGKRFIIAGGATGIGAATVERLVSEGAHVAIGDINASTSPTACIWPAEVEITVNLVHIHKAKRREIGRHLLFVLGEDFHLQKAPVV